MNHEFAQTPDPTRDLHELGLMAAACPDFAEDFVRTLLAADADRQAPGEAEIVIVLEGRKTPPTVAMPDQPLLPREAAATSDQSGIVASAEIQRTADQQQRD